MIIKSYYLENKIDSIVDKKIYLFYGENIGLKKEFKLKLKNIYKKAENLHLLQDEIIKDRSILANEILNKSLFEERKIIFVDQVNDKTLEIIEEIEHYIQDERIFLFADILDKKSQIRSYFEKSKINGITACYKDDENTIKNLITKKLNGFQGLNLEIINLIIKNTNLNRDKVNNEIEKIYSCFHDKKLNFKTINNLLNNESNDDFNLLRDVAFKGDKIKTNRLLADTVFETEKYIYYLNSINQRIEVLKEIENQKKNDLNIELIISKMRPPIFWKDKPKIIEQSMKWNINKINQVLKKSFNIEIELKSNNAIRKDLLIKNFIVDLCSAANAS